MIKKNKLIFISISYLTIIALLILIILIIKKNKENQYFLLELYYPGYSIGHKDYFTSFFSIKQNNYYEMKKVKKLFNSNDVHLIVLKNNFNESNYLIKVKILKNSKK